MKGWWDTGGSVQTMFCSLAKRTLEMLKKKKKKIVVLLLLGWGPFSTSLLSPFDLLVDGRSQKELPVNA